MQNVKQCKELRGRLCGVVRIRDGSVASRKLSLWQFLTLLDNPCLTSSHFTAHTVSQKRAKGRAKGEAKGKAR